MNFFCRTRPEGAESTDRHAVDYFHLGLVFWGLIAGAAGVELVSAATFVFGLLLVAWGMAYFWMELE